MNHAVILIGQTGLGSGDAALGGLILANFLRLLGERDDLPECIVLWNEGVKIAVEGSNWINHLKRLEEQGVRIVSCRTCVEYFGLEESITTGEIIPMTQIQDILFSKSVLTV
jgi:intracellular sulfur oxidation DsrE/DsrF family protein